MRCRFNHYVFYLPITASFIAATSELARSVTQKDPCDDFDLNVLPEDFVSSSKELPISSEAVDDYVHSNQNEEAKLVGGTIDPSPGNPTVQISEFHSSFPAHHLEEPLAQQLSSANRGKLKATDVNQSFASKKSRHAETSGNNDSALKIEKDPLHDPVTGTDQPFFQPHGIDQIINHEPEEELPPEKISSPDDQTSCSEAVDHTAHSNQHASADQKPVEETKRPLKKIISVPIPESHSSFFAHHGKDPLAQRLTSASPGEYKDSVMGKDQPYFKSDESDRTSNGEPQEKLPEEKINSSDEETTSSEVVDHFVPLNPAAAHKLVEETITPMEEITPAPISELPLILSPHHGGDPPAPRLPSTSPGEHKASHLIPISRSKESEQDEIYVNSELTSNIEKCVPLQVSVTGTDQPSFKPDGSGQISNRVSGEELAAQKISSSSEKHISLEDVDRSVYSNQHTSADDKPVEEKIRPLGEITSVPISEPHSGFFAHQGEDPLLVQQLSSTSSGKRKICDFNQGSSSKKPKQDDITRKNDPTLKSDKRAFLQISAMGITQSHLKSKGIIRDKKPPTKFANFELPPEIQRNKQGAKRENHAPP
ncbi:hypothetical protein PCANC_17997 [Puccinia coronata f. sp. avenae]|uniref:Uncharacterized protein n=1 Tax=Puccinia coronata f. sp. avenae TaxID=200324 RepID=A0A2N5U3B9_9BASI|nr:hypothetical protein PCANC_17997 [Puccinia coronata f. sp. avenae]